MNRLYPTNDSPGEGAPGPGFCGLPVPVCFFCFPRHGKLGWLGPFGGCALVLQTRLSLLWTLVILTTVVCTC